MKIVLAHGVFDCIHYGHLYHLTQAKALGDVLIVNIVGDDFVTKPIISKEHDRADVLKALRCVDAVYISHDPTPITALRNIKPHIYCRGYDYEGRQDSLPESPVIKELGIEFVITKGVPIHSSDFREDS